MIDAAALAIGLLVGGFWVLSVIAVILAIAALISAFSTGCNTTRGIGKDIEKAGDKIQDASR